MEMSEEAKSVKRNLTFVLNNYHKDLAKLLAPLIKYDEETLYEMITKCTKIDLNLLKNMENN